MTFQSSRNAASEALKKADEADGLKRQHSVELAQAHTALAQAEAHHELASALGALAGAVARWQR